MRGAFAPPLAEALVEAGALGTRFLAAFTEPFVGARFEAFLVDFFALIQLASQMSADRAVRTAANRELQELHCVRVIGEHPPL